MIVAQVKSIHSFQRHVFVKFADLGEEPNRMGMTYYSIGPCERIECALILQADKFANIHHRKITSHSKMKATEKLWKCYF